MKAWPPYWPDKDGDEMIPDGLDLGMATLGKTSSMQAKRSTTRFLMTETILLHPYTPDTTDLTRKGAGILVGVRLWNGSRY